MSRCLKCDQLPTLGQGLLSVFLWPPLGHTLGKIKSIVRHLDNYQVIDGGISFSLDSQIMPAMIKKLNEGLSRSEKHDTNCLVFEGLKTPSLADFSCVTNLQKMAGLYSASWLLDILATRRMTSHFQPIVYAQRQNLPFAHECLLRWHDQEGNLNPPSQLFKTAEEADLIFQLDRAAREIHIRSAHEKAVSTKVFVNFAPTAIYDADNCLRSTFEIIREIGIDPSQIVFEIVETERIDEPDHMKSILSTYQSHGFKAALDDLGSGHSTLNMLGALKPDYVKLDMEMIRNVHKDRFKSELVRKIVELSHNFGIEVIAEGIETKEEAAWLVSQDVDYMQGFYFAKPQEHPREILDRRATA
ncbi:EAL domain-containing protein [Terasakiella sp. A23]|uniref:EAL domain-containing protein n=1 Tax=Terasakiella sp. FCG-A23 TaxID=3080561 RepID=UPI002953384D|nr:EAL domain-containing protein [Terasakiella sp. A23]MDV7339097.1 EAL domain-containing protein [Terasakiella sp. A23]